jgi:hypothetical protein
MKTMMTMKTMTMTMMTMMIQQAPDASQPQDLLHDTLQKHHGIHPLR